MKRRITCLNYMCIHMYACRYGHLSEWTVCGCFEVMLCQAKFRLFFFSGVKL